MTKRGLCESGAIHFKIDMNPPRGAITLVFPIVRGIFRLIKHIHKEIQRSMVSKGLRKGLRSEPSLLIRVFPPLVNLRKPKDVGVTVKSIESSVPRREGASIER